MRNLRLFSMALECWHGARCGSFRSMRRISFAEIDEDGVTVFSEDMGMGIIYKLDSIIIFRRSEGGVETLIGQFDDLCTAQQLLKELALEAYKLVNIDYSEQRYNTQYIYNKDTDEVDSIRAK